MSFSITTPEIGFQGIHDTDTVQNHSLGTIVDAVDPVYGNGRFIYLRGVASTVVGSLVVISNGFATALTGTASRGPVAVAMTANVANQFGWYQIMGTASALAAAAAASGAMVYATATAGQVDDAVVSGAKVDGAVFAAAASGAGAVLVQLSNPCLNGNG